MNVTKNVITDLLPLYVENECSADTRALIDEYLKSNPQQAEELRRILSVDLPAGTRVSPRDLDETRALRDARRAVNRRSWVMAFAIFCSLAPFSFLSTGGKTYWLVLESPPAAIAYGAVGIVLWIVYASMRFRSRDL